MKNTNCQIIYGGFTILVSEDIKSDSLQTATMRGLHAILKNYPEEPPYSICQSILLFTQYSCTCLM